MSEQFLAHPACSQSHVCQSNGHFCPSVLRQLYDAVLLVDVQQKTVTLAECGGHFSLHLPEDATPDSLLDTLVEPDDAASLRALLAPAVWRQLQLGGETRLLHARCRLPDGRRVRMEFFVYPLPESEGEGCFLLGLRQARHAGRHQEEATLPKCCRYCEAVRFRTALASTRTLVFEWRAPLELTYVSPKIMQDFAGNYDGRHLFTVWLEDDVVHVDDRHVLEDCLRRLRQGEAGGREFRLRLRNREDRFCWYQVAWLSTGEQAERRFIATINNVDKAVRDEHNLRFRDVYDDLTGVPNMGTFCAQGQMLLREAVPHAIVCFDVGRFKHFNKKHTYEEGNRLLRAIAFIASGMLQRGEIIGHVAVDIFAVCLRGGKDRARHFVAGVCDTLHHGYSSKMDVRLYFGTRIVEPGEEGQIRQFFDQAREALKTVKGSYLRHHAFYDANLGRRLDCEQLVESNMVEGIVQHQFVPFFQPRVSMRSGRLVGAEVLARWQQSPDVQISPDNFVPLFERNGFIVRFDHYMWECACRQLRAWLDQGLTPPRLSLNVSRIHFQDAGIADFLLGLLDSYRVPPTLLELELTESAFVGNEMHARPTMDRLRKAGLTFSIDDFGTGFSSITTLCLLPFDVLKLDKGLLVNCLSNPRLRTLLHHLVPLGQEMGMEVVAEGVETVEQARFLMECGCDQAQGFLFARPLAAEDFTRRCLEIEGPFTTPLGDDEAPAEQDAAPVAPRP